MAGAAIPTVRGRRANDTAPGASRVGSGSGVHSAHEDEDRPGQGWPPRSTSARAVLIGLRLASLLPLPARRRLGGFLWIAAFLGDARRRGATVDTMATVARATGHPNPWRLARDAWRAHGEMLAEAAGAVAWPGRPVDDLVGEVSGWAHLEAALALGRGAVLVGLHQGNWEVGATLIARRHALAAVVDPVGPPALDVVVQASRRERGIHVIRASDGARGALRALQRGAALAVLVDRPAVPGPGVETVPFLGVPTAFPVGAIRLARRAGAPVLALTGWRRPDGRLGFAAGGPIRITDVLTDADVLSSLLADLEVPVRRAPSGWFMFRRTWPANAPHDGTGAGTRRTVEIGAVAATFVMRLGARVVGRAPDRPAREAAGAIGTALACRPGPRRAAMAANVAAVTGMVATDPAVVRAVTRAHRLQAENYVDLWRTPAIDGPEARRRVEVSGAGWDRLRADLAAGGAVLVSAHVGRLELLGHALRREGFPVVLVVEQLCPPGVHALVERLRARPGLAVVVAADGLRCVVRALDSGALVVVLADWVPPMRDGQASRFEVAVGQGRMDVPALPFRLAARRRRPMHFGYGLALPDGRVRAVVEAPLGSARDAAVAWGDDPEADAFAMASAFGRRLGAVIARDPGQWTLGHPVARPASTPLNERATLTPIHSS